jgi:hypothetical protein
MNLIDGDHLRMERQRLRLSLHTLAELADYDGASPQRISCFEHGGRLRADVTRRIEHVLEGLDRIKRSFPFSLDMKDIPSLKLALAAYERGDAQWFAERNIKPELPNFITY